MPNKLIKPDIILAETLRLVHQKANFLGNINTSYDNKFAKQGAKVGDTIEVRLPNRYTVRHGPEINIQDTKERKKKIRINKQAGVDMEFTSKELTLDIDDFSHRFIEPAVTTLVSAIESEMLSEIHPKITSWTWVKKDDKLFTKILEGNERLSAKLCPDDGDRHFWMSTHESGRLVEEVSGLFNPQAKISRMLKSGEIGKTANNNFYTNTHLQTFTEDIASSLELIEHESRQPDKKSGGKGQLSEHQEIVLASAIHARNQPITTLDLSLATRIGSKDDEHGPLGDAIKPGTGLQIKDLQMLHPQTKKPTGYSWRGIITKVEDKAQSSTITIDPPLYWQEQITIDSNVVHVKHEKTIAPNVINITDGKHVKGDLIELTLLKKPAYHPLSLMIQAHPDAFVFGTADLVMPEGLDFKSRQTHEGISMRIIRKYDYKEDKFPCRIDCLYGYEYLRDELAHKYFCE